MSTSHLAAPWVDSGRFEGLMHMHWTFHDPYAVLGLPNGAPMDVVRKRFRQLALVVHPDKFKADHASTVFDAVNKAFRSISEAGR